MNATTKILVIDPDPDIRMTLEYTLSRAGFAPLIAKTADEGLHHCFSGRPRVVLSEVALGNMTGYELCGRIKGEPVIGHTTKFILLTSHPENEVFVRGPEVCADYFIAKPCHPPDLVADLLLITGEDFRPTPESLDRLRLAKRVPTHRESITPSYASSNKRTVHLNPPEVRYADRMERKSQVKAAVVEKPRDPHLVEVNHLLKSLVGSFRETRRQIEEVVQYLDREVAHPPHTRN